MFKKLKKFGSKCKDVLKSKVAAVSALAVSFFASSAVQAAGELVTETEGVVTVNPDALVSPVRTAMTSAITSASTIFIIVFVVGIVIYFIRRFSRG